MTTSVGSDSVVRLLPYSLDNLTFQVTQKDGTKRTYEILNVEQLFPGKETPAQTLDRKALLKLGKEERLALLEAAQKAAQSFADLQKIEGIKGLQGAHTFTVSFHEKGASHPSLLHRVTYVPKKGNPEKRVNIHLQNYGEAAKKGFESVMKPLSNMLTHVLSSKPKKPAAKDRPANETSSSPPPLPPSRRSSVHTPPPSIEVASDEFFSQSDSEDLLL